ncbi:monodehydroascorbate reductase 4, peroxisomal-like isoform X1 [Malus domestica]|uniref:monodehydroascorbate reductase 4, peroxisomal-like isoform X1 n=1 Tax=Malus domestica TaxID=3750 RepID=UPI003976D899
MGRAFVYVILGGGVAAGYAALEFTKRGISHGELCIISEESVPPYERPALSKGFLLPEAPARLPSFHTCVGANEERLTPEWYKEHGIELVIGTQVKSVDVRRKTLLAGSGETISYKVLIIATGARVTAVNLRDGSSLPADVVVVGIGIRPNKSLFEGQLTLEKGGIKVNGKMQSSNSSVYAVGDVATFPVKVFGESRRLEHVDSARKSARHAVTAIMERNQVDEFDYLPFFYSRIFTLSWQFYGDNAGDVVHFGDFSGGTFGAYWVRKGQLVGSFLEGGTKEEYEAIAKATRQKPEVEDLAELERQGLGFALTVSQKPQPSSPPHDVTSSGIVQERPMYTFHATVGVVVAASIAALAYWYGRKRRRW